MKSNVVQKGASGPDSAFLGDLSALRARAREQMMQGAVTPRYPGGLEDVPKV